MKKIFAVLMCMSLFLCGCSELTDGGSSAVKETFPEYYADEETRVRYESESEFLDSDFCDEMKQNGYTIYQLSYDEERYELLGMLSDRNLYKYQLTDKETGAEVDYSISYNVGYLEHPSDAFANADDTSKDVSTTVEKDGQEFDVYISRTPYVEEDEYGIVYLPFEDYKVSIYADAPTPEDALAYIHDFDLVPSENTAPTEKVFYNEVRTIEYHTIPEFLESESCKAMQSEGFAVYLPSYDAAQYELRRITSDAAFYEFSFIETATGKYVVYSVLYRTCFKSADEFAQLYPDTADENILTSVEKDGVSQDVYIVKTPYTEDACYNLSYLPMEGYEVYIGSNSDTPEDALAYIHDFDLVPASE